MVAPSSSDAFKQNLVIVHTPDAQHLSDWHAVKEKINERAPDIDVRIVNNNKPDPDIDEWQLARPSLVFSACNLTRFRPAGGKIYVGGYVDKLAQLRRLADAGVRTPRTLLLSPGLSLDSTVWGEYVVVKPSSKRSSFGRGVIVDRAESVGVRFSELTGGGRLRMIVQELIDATDEAGCIYAYRVLTMFERPLYCNVHKHGKPPPPLAEIYNRSLVNPFDRESNVIAHNAKIKGVTHHLRLVDDADVLDVAARTARAMCEFPVLGIDIVREKSTGDLYVLETNSGGNVWHLSSKIAYLQREKDRLKKYRQFGALDVAANALIEKTRKEATWFALDLAAR